MLILLIGVEIIMLLLLMLANYFFGMFGLYATVFIILFLFVLKCHL